MLIISKAAELEFNSNTWSFLLDVHLINLVDGNSKLGYKRWSNNCFGRKSQNCHNSQDEIMSLTFGTAHINWKCFQSWFYCSPPEEYSGIKGNSIYIESKLERSPACSGGSPPIILFVRKETQNLATPKNFPSLFWCASISCTDYRDWLTDKLTLDFQPFLMSNSSLTIHLILDPIGMICLVGNSMVPTYCPIIQTAKLCNIEIYAISKFMQCANLCNVQNHVMCKLCKVQNYAMWICTLHSFQINLAHLFMDF